MKNQPEQKPNILRTLIAVGALTGAFCAWKACGPEISQLAARAVQPIRQVASSLVTDLTTQKPDTLYNMTTNEVAILKGMLALGPKYRGDAEKRASDFYFKNLSNISMRDLVDSPIKRDVRYREAISFIKSTGKIE
jgi:hypothetical protein